MLPLSLLALAAAQATGGIPINRTWDRLEPPDGDLDHRALFLQAGELLDRRPIYIDAVRFDRKMLRRLARASPKEPFLRVVREATRRPVDLEDLLYFIDDVLVARQKGLGAVWVPASRARRAGIFVHPDDVFLDDQPRRYGEAQNRIKVDKPKPVTRLPAAKDGEHLGPRWCSRYPNPSGTRGKLRALKRLNPSGTFSRRVRSLMRQLRRQGATVLLYSTVRDRRRGYLIWGAYSLARKTTAEEVTQHAALLDRLNTEWKLEVPIRWQHPDGWKATVRAARRMADSYRVAFASRAGAEHSNHYDGVAVDLNVFGLPRSLKLRAPDGATRTFDLSEPNETRDLSLTPHLIEWVEKHFEMEKLKSDYPHWNDAAAQEAVER